MYANCYGIIIKFIYFICRIPHTQTTNVGKIDCSDHLSQIFTKLGINYMCKPQPATFPVDFLAPGLVEPAPLAPQSQSHTEVSTQVHVAPSTKSVTHSVNSVSQSSSFNNGPQPNTPAELRPTELPFKAPSTAGGNVDTTILDAQKSATLELSHQEVIQGPGLELYDPNTEPLYMNLMVEPGSLGASPTNQELQPAPAATNTAVEPAPPVEPTLPVVPVLPVEPANQAAPVDPVSQVDPLAPLSPVDPMVPLDTVATAGQPPVPGQPSHLESSILNILPLDQLVILAPVNSPSDPFAVTSLDTRPEISVPLERTNTPAPTTVLVAETTMPTLPEIVNETMADVNATQPADIVLAPVDFLPLTVLDVATLFSDPSPEVQNSSEPVLSEVESVLSTNGTQQSEVMINTTEIIQEPVTPVYDIGSSNMSSLPGLAISNEPLPSTIVDIPQPADLVAEPVAVLPLTVLNITIPDVMTTNSSEPALATDLTVLEPANQTVEAFNSTSDANLTSIPEVAIVTPVYTLDSISATEVDATQPVADIVGLNGIEAAVEYNTTSPEMGSATVQNFTDQTLLIEPFGPVSSPSTAPLNSTSFLEPVDQLAPADIVAPAEPISQVDTMVASPMEPAATPVEPVPVTATQMDLSQAAPIAVATPVDLGQAASIAVATPVDLGQAASIAVATPVDQGQAAPIPVAAPMDPAPAVAAVAEPVPVVPAVPAVPEAAPVATTTEAYFMSRCLYKSK